MSPAPGPWLGAGPLFGGCDARFGRRENPVPVSGGWFEALPEGVPLPVAPVHRPVGHRRQDRPAGQRSSATAGRCASRATGAVRAEVLPPGDASRRPGRAADTGVPTAHGIGGRSSGLGRSWRLAGVVLGSPRWRARVRRTGPWRWAGRDRSFRRTNRARGVPRIPVAAPDGIGQQQVRLLDREEPDRVATAGIRVVALGEPAMRGLDLLIGGATWHAQLPVRVR